MNRKTIEDTLFEETTSRNAKQEFLPIFDMLYSAHEDGCSFYQGCGEDICTLLIPNIDVHVFSDSDAGWSGRIKQKLNKLSEAGLISELSHRERDETRLTYRGVSKVLRFTQRPISEINFAQSYGTLRVIFEFNPGDSALCQAFWDAVASKLAPGGYLLGSYIDSPERLNREAWCLSGDGQEYSVWVFHRDYAITGEEGLGRFIQESGVDVTAWPQTLLIDFEDSKYLVSCWNYNEAIHSTSVRNRYLVRRVECIPISTFNLRVVKMVGRMSLLQKQL